MKKPPGDPVSGVQMAIPPEDMTNRGEVPTDGMERLKVLLRKIYGEQGGRRALDKIKPLVEEFGTEKRGGSNYYF